VRKKDNIEEEMEMGLGRRVGGGGMSGGNTGGRGLSEIQ
jgi:hypothetical protein